MSEPTGQKFELRTFSDLLKLDDGQLERFCADLHFYVRCAIFCNSLISDVEGKPTVACSLECIPWIDDGIKEFSPHLATGEKAFTIRANKATQ